MKKSLIPFAFYIFLSISLSAQNNTSIDALLANLSAKTIEDTFRVNTLLQLAKATYMSDPIKTQEYAKQAHQLASKINFKRGMADGYRFEGIAFYSMGNFKDAQVSLENALKINEEIKNNTGILASLSILGTINTVQNNYPSALNYFQKVIRLGEKIKEYVSLGVTYTNMGVIYSELKNYDLALKYFKNGLDINTQINSKIGIAGSLANMGNVYYQTKDFEKALDHYHKALSLNIEIDNKLGIAREYGNIASVYNEQKIFDESYSYYTKALETNHLIKNKKGIAVSLQGIGRYYLEKKEFNAALAYTKQANDLATEIKVQDIQKETFDNLSLIYEGMGKMDSAYLSFKKYTDLKDNIDNENNRKQISRLEIQYEFDNKEEKYKTAELLSKEKIEQQRLLLALNQAKLNESNKERDIVRLNYLKKESELKAEKLEKVAQEKQLAIIGNEVELSRKELLIKNITIAASKKQKSFLLLGLGLLSIIGGLLFWQSRSRKKSNAKLLSLNAELDKANKVKAKFFAILSHDLRAPVANLINFLHLQNNAPELLNAEMKSKNEVTITSSAEMLLENMESMLLWSKSQMEHFKPTINSIKIDSLFEHIKNFFIDTKNISLLFENDANLIINTDQDYLQIIMQNLTSNAIKALSNTEQPTIKWAARLIENKTVLSITDNGPGMSDAIIAALHTDENTIGSKHGLGIYLIRDMAKAIDCTIKVFSKNIGGSEVQLWFNS
jgi:signal transduction histidine kinase